MKKMLMVATVPSMIGQFNMNNIQILQDNGFEVHIACDFNDISVWNDERIKKFKMELNDKGIRFHQIDFSRKALNLFEHINAYKQLKKLLKDEEYVFVHCHTPIAGALARLVCHKLSVKCIYTAHGFHFYKGAPLLNWLIYYPIELWCSKYTDSLVTINTEDYEFAKRKMKAKKIYYVPGVGINIAYFKENRENRIKLREEYNIPSNVFVLLSIGELNKNKNHQLVIRAISQMKNDYIRYYIVGKGVLMQRLNNISMDLDVYDRVKLLGYRRDVKNLYNIADGFIFPSYREGLSVALMEAMASGLPVACSKIRGNVDLIDENGGVLFNPNNLDECKEAISKLLSDDSKKMGEYNRNKMQNYDISQIMISMKNIYEEISTFV